MDYLVKDSNNWTHPFLSNSSKSAFLCRLCAQSASYHNDSRQYEKSKSIKYEEEEYTLDDCGICYLNISEREVMIL